MLEELKISMEWARQYNDEGLHVILLLFALIYIWRNKEEKHHRKLFIGYTLLFFFVYFCPLTSFIITKAIGHTVYWRMFWLLPLPCMLAYSFVKFWSRTEGKAKRAVSLLLFAAAVSLTGQVIYIEDSPYETRKNWEKLPEAPEAIVRIINENREEGEWVLLLAPSDMVPWIRMYDAQIHQVYGRKGNVWEGGGYLKRAADKEVLDHKKLCRKAREIRCNFMVLKNSEIRTEKMAKYNFQLIGQVGDYVIFKDMDQIYMGEQQTDARGGKPEEE